MQEDERQQEKYPAEARMEENQPEEAEPKRRRRRSEPSRRSFFSRLRGARLLPLAAAVVLIAAAALYSRFGPSNTFYSSRTVEMNLKDIGELATQAAFYTDVITIHESDRTILGISIPFTSTNALCTYSGTIKAGLDFGAIRLQTDTAQKKLQLTMPQIRILSHEVDLGSLKVYEKGKNPFNIIGVDQMNRAMINMKQGAEEKAIDKGLLTAAKNNAEKLLQSMLRSIPELREYQFEFVWEGETQETGGEAS